MTKQEFIDEIAKAVQKHASKYGIKVHSPIIAQACLESGYGTSNKAKYHNYFGLKYRKGRVTCNSGYFNDSSSEQKADGSYVPITTDWYSFDTLDSGVEGYFQFINIDRYSNLKGVTEAYEYLLLIKEDGYATSLDYVRNVYNVIEQWNLTKYDNKEGSDKAMGYTNSSLVSYTKLSPNHSGQRTHSIDRISPHCVVGQCSVETLGEIFYPSSRQASCQYGIGPDGRVGMYVEEKNRSWCTSSNENDQRAITIECASDTSHPYAMKDAVYETLIKLCTDICQRYGKTKLIWYSDKNTALNYEPKSNEMLLTVHRWFANKSCPGDWLFNRLGDVASRVTANLSGTSIPSIEPTPSTGSKSITEIANEVINGVWGNGEDRKNRLTAAGYDYSEVQSKVKDILSGNVSTSTEEKKEEKTTNELYRVRKSWSDSSSQIGAYKILDNAKKVVDSNPGYSVFNSKGSKVYPEEKKEENTTVTGSTKASSYAKSYDSSLAGRYTTTDDLNCRDGAGTSKGILCTIPKGTKVMCYGYYTEYKNIKWLYIQFTLNGIQYTGFSSSAYLKK